LPRRSLARRFGRLLLAYHHAGAPRSVRVLSDTLTKSIFAACCWSSRLDFTYLICTAHVNHQPCHLLNFVHASILDVYKNYAIQSFVGDKILALMEILDPQRDQAYHREHASAWWYASLCKGSPLHWPHTYQHQPTSVSFRL
jgi:hypothetical protein